MSKAKIELSAFIFVISGWSAPEHVGLVFYTLFGLAIAIWLAALFKRAHPNLVRSQYPQFSCLIGKPRREKMKN